MADLDRLITLYVSDQDTRNEFGESVDGAVHVYRVWASVDDAVADITFGVIGLVLSDERTYRVRWRRDLADGPVTLIDLADADGATFRVTRIREVGRRRFLDLFTIAGELRNPNAMAPA